MAAYLVRLETSACRMFDVRRRTLAICEGVMSVDRGTVMVSVIDLEVLSSPDDWLLLPLMSMI